MAAILVAWTGTTYGVFSSGSQIYFVQRGQALQERFVVEAEFFTQNASSHMIKIFVRNVGAEEIGVVGIFINTNTTQLSFPPSTSLITGSPCIVSGQSVTIPVGIVCEFDVDWGTSWSSGTIFNTVVTSARGNKAVFAARGP